MPQPDSRERFFALLRPALGDGSLRKLTLGKPRGGDPTLKNLFIRPVALKAGPHLAFVWRYATRDVTKNFSPAEALAQLEQLIGRDFLDAHLFTATHSAQLQCEAEGTARVKISQADTEAAAAAPAPPAAHDRAKTRLIPADAPWLRALGVTNERGHPREGMADKFHQIQKFAELLTHLMADADFPGDEPLHVVDMGAGKGYLTFAVAALLGERARVEGIEARAELVTLCNRIAGENGFSNLHFTAGTIEDSPVEKCDVLIALHACDTATDDALAKGLAAQARLLVVAPCCQKELRPQLTAPPVLADPLRHGIFQERHAEFATDALRAMLLEWAGYRTKVFEFVSTGHTPKNLMIAATRLPAPDPRRADEMAARIREFAAFYGVRAQQLAKHLGFALQP